MEKVSNNLSTKRREENSKSNSNYVENIQDHQESSIALSPPILNLDQQKEQSEEEEVVEKSSSSLLFDQPPDEDDSDPINNDDSASSENNSSRKNPYQLKDTLQLKRNYEMLHGFSLSDVKVVHNSSKPAQLKAEAFAIGNEVHLGPGHDDHLAHELGHIIQQKQGRVAPDENINGVPVNTDPGLESEADQMGEAALQFSKAPFSPPMEETSSKLNNTSSSPGMYQFKKPTKKGDQDGKVEKKISAEFPEIPLGEKDFKYVSANVGVKAGLEVSFMVDESLKDTPDEVAVGPQGIAVKKEGPNLIKKEIGDKIHLEVKNGLEVNANGGKIGMECKMGEKSLLKDYAVEFSFIELDWTEPMADKIKILSATFKVPVDKLEGTWIIGGEPHKVVAKYGVNVGVEVNKSELMKQVLLRFGHLFTAEVAIAGGMVLAGAMTIAAALHNVYMGKDIAERINTLVDQIISYVGGFKTGYYANEGGGGSFHGIMDGISARLSACAKMPKPVFEEKLKSGKMSQAFYNAIVASIQIFKRNALRKFKEDHGLEDDDFMNRDLVTFKRVLDAATSSNDLQKRIIKAT